MTTNNRALTAIEKLIASKNSIPLNEIKKTVVEGADGVEVVRCYLKLPEKYDDGVIKLTGVKRKRRRYINRLGMYGIKFEIVFWETYLYCKQGVEEALFEDR